jgi:hypothetical protein
MMKYWMRENENHTHTLMRYDEECSGLPSNPELEFWLALQDARSLLREVLKTTTLTPLPPKLVAEIKDALEE